jgi:hypothetical protein
MHLAEGSCSRQHSNSQKRGAPMVQLLLLLIVSFSVANSQTATPAPPTPPPLTTAAPTNQSNVTNGTNTTAAPFVNTTIAPNTTSAPNTTAPPTPAPTTTVPANASRSPTPAPFDVNNSQSIDWYIVVVGIGLVFIIVGASCYVTLMWQQKAVRDYKGKFEELLKDRGMQRRLLEEEVAKREEAKYKDDSDSDDSDDSDKDKEEGKEKEKEKAPEGPSKYDVSHLRANAQQQQLLTAPRQIWKREPIEAARRGPMMVQRSTDMEEQERANQMLAALKEKERQRNQDQDRQQSALERSLSLTAAAHKNISRLKSQSQLKNIASLL